MKISFFQFFPFTIWTPGGGEVQLKKTQDALEKKGVEVVKFDIWDPKRDFDILHVFGSTYQLRDFVVAAKMLEIKIIVSAIAYSYKSGFSWFLMKILNRLIPLKTTYSYRKDIYDNADIIISGSEVESQQLKKNFKVEAKKIRVVYNAADRNYANADPQLFIEKYEKKDFVLMVSRISDHKGQIRLIDALKNENIQMLFIGSEDPSDHYYYEKFLKKCDEVKNVSYLGPIYDKEMLASAFAASAVHVLPSKSECPGLVNLEAGLAGTRVVAGYSPPTYEHLGDDAIYCNPKSLESIRAAVKKAISKPKNENLKNRILQNFTWEKVADDTINIYKEILKVNE